MLDAEIFLGKGAVQQPRHHEGGRRACEVEAVEEKALAIHAPHRSIRHDEGNEEGVDGEACRTRHHGRHQNGEQALAPVGQGAGGHDGGDGAGHAAHEAHCAASAQPQPAQVPVPHVPETRHRAAVLEEGREAEEDHDLG